MNIEDTYAVNDGLRILFLKIIQNTLIMFEAIFLYTHISNIRAIKFYSYSFYIVA